MCAIGFKSGEDVDRSTSFSSNHLVIAWARRLRSLSFCMTHAWFKFNYFTDSTKYFCKISRSISPFMLLPRKTRFPTPEEDKQLQHFAFFPPYLGAIGLGLCFFRCSPDHNFGIGLKQVQSTFISPQHVI